MTRDPGRVLEVRRLVAAPIANVYQAFESPEAWWCPEGLTLVSAESDFRPGGRYRIGMRAPDEATMHVHGVYEVLEPPSKLVFTHIFDLGGAGRRWAKLGFDGRPARVTITLRAVGDRTELLLVEEGLPSEEAIDHLKSGWGSILDRFTRLVEDTN